MSEPTTTRWPYPPLRRKASRDGAVARYLHEVALFVLVKIVAVARARAATGWLRQGDMVAARRGRPRKAG